MLLTFAQTQYSSVSKAMFHFDRYSSTLKNRLNNQDLPQRVIAGKVYIPLMVKVSDPNAFNHLPAGMMKGSMVGTIATLYVLPEILSQWPAIPGVEYAEIAPSIIRPDLDKALHDTSVDSVHMGFNLPHPFSGEGVLIGITDWGFDYTNPMFYDTSLTHTRIEKAWDQYRLAGPAPSGFAYGAEIVGETNLLAAQCDTFNIYEWATHGSHVAGICGGSGAGTPYKGVAFGAHYILATFLVDAAAVMDAYVWMKDYAVTSGKRLVINQSWGLYYMGTLDGSSLLSQAIDQLSSEGVVFVCAAGNNGDVNLHIRYDAESQDTMKTVAAFDSYAYYPKMWGQCISSWGTPNCPYSISIGVLNSSNQALLTSPWMSTNNLPIYLEDTLITGTDSIFFNIACDSANALNNRPHIQLRVRNTNASLKIALYVHADSGTVHLWNIIELTNGVGNWGSAFLAPLAGWTAGDSYFSIGEPACTESVISVAAYNSEYTYPNNVTVGGYISSFSSYGPIMDGRMKPDIAAPGQNVCSSVSSFTNTSFAPSSVVTSVSFLGRTYKFVRFSGTSMSSPMVTGIVALLLEANPLLTPSEIKDILKETAREDLKTGVIPDTGSTRWGWGKVNALHAIYLALGILNIGEISNEQTLSIAPNPSDGLITIYASDGILPDIAEIYNMNGTLIRSVLIHDAIIDVSSIPPACYLIRLQLKDSVQILKLIKE